MQTWEYVTVNLTNPKDSEAQLNALGRDGWELVAVSGLSTTLVVAFLKRPTTGAK